jgi:protein-S-isoprenylcysteine O-methyltransferase Ste14
MSLGHLVFAIATTAYMLIAIQFEEHDMIAVFGDRYRGDRASVSMIVPWFRARAPEPGRLDRPCSDA